MLLWSAIAVLCLALAGLTTIILFDVRAKGWPNWLSTLRDWQSTLGTVAGFLSAAGALMLSSAIQSNAEAERADRAAAAIGQALAYEVERMVGPLQTAYSIATTISPADAALPHVCTNLMRDMLQTLVDATPVYDAVLGQTPDFGDYNLALFTRTYAYFHDFRREIGTDADARCRANPAGEIEYVKQIMRSGFAYYQLVAASYPAVTPLQDGILPAPDNTSTPPGPQ
jgi:hypothetical protein